MGRYFTMPLETFSRAVSHTSLRVLVVDDDSAVRRLLAAYLTCASHQPTAVATRREAMALLADQPFDVVVTDVFLPDGDGMDIVSHLMQTRSGARAVAVTGGSRYLGTEFFRRVGHALGAVVLQKPFGRETFLAAVEGRPVPEEDET